MASPNTSSTGGSAFDAEARDAAKAAQWEWRRLERQPPARRVALVPELGWQRGYALSSPPAYPAVTGQIAAAATQAALANPEARPSLQHLAATALHAAGQPTATH